MSEPTCAVWYYRYHSVYYELCDDEQSAVSFASHLSDSGEGVVVGVQFEDGRFVKDEEWTALADYERKKIERWEAALVAERLNPTPKRPLRTVRLPWDTTDTAHVEGDVPAWLGATVSR